MGSPPLALLTSYAYLHDAYSIYLCTCSHGAATTLAIDLTLCPPRSEELLLPQEEPAEGRVAAVRSCLQGTPPGTTRFT